jgi:hypothetical protein
VYLVGLQIYLQSSFNKTFYGFPCEVPIQEENYVMDPVSLLP